MTENSLNKIFQVKVIKGSQKVGYMALIHKQKSITFFEQSQIKNLCFSSVFFSSHQFQTYGILQFQFIILNKFELKMLSRNPEGISEELSSTVRRSINALKEKEVSVRKNALAELSKVVKSQELSPADFEEITHMGLKEFIRCYYDSAEANRENAIILTIDLLTRCKNISTFLPYIMEVLKDRTNCVDLEGVDNLPQKLRPSPGQKPKVMLKTIETCEQIRVLYCGLLKRIISLVDKDKKEMVRHLDDMVNILRALIMDPAPEIQKNACQTLELFCQDYKDILLHFTQTMGRAVLLPLISKKSKIRIAGLNCLTAIFWCGLWKYNAFVFQNLIGFRDPNSVPIKDFYQPSNNINYLATFIIDSNVKVRQEFMRHIKIWICDLNDKFDHHGKLVPYLLSGLFDADEKVRETALEAIREIGKQIQEEKEKQFRENKQFAIDAVWTWEGKLVGLPVQFPLTARPSLGSRFFIRGHVRRFWPALYKQIRDINQENRIRAVNLALYGVVFTENYLTQFLDVMIPQFLPSILPITSDDKLVCEKVCRIFYYIGRYCQQSAYIHLMASALDGKLIQNQQFVKCAMKGLSMLISGNLQAVPEDESLCHKKDNIIQLLNVLQDCQIAGDVYNFNCVEAREISICILEGIKNKATSEEKEEIFSIHFPTLMKLLAVSTYEQIYSFSVGFAVKNDPLLQENPEVHTLYTGKFDIFAQWMTVIQQSYSQSFDRIQEYLEQMFCDPPTLMDSDWKILIVLYRYLLTKGSTTQEYHQLFLLVQDAICECISKNRSIDILGFSSKFLLNLISAYGKTEQTELKNSSKLLRECLNNLSSFQAMKKVPIYDQHLLKQDPNPDIIKTSEENYLTIFKISSQCLAQFYVKKIPISNNQLASLLLNYFKALRKIERNKESCKEAIKAIWAVFQKIKVKGHGGQEQLTENLGHSLSFKDERTKETVHALPHVIDFAVERLEEYIDPKLSTLVFGILENIVKTWPKAKSVTEKMPHIYPAYGDLLQKLFKYALNEKDIETRQKYKDLLSCMCRKMPDWFKIQLKMATEAQRHQKSKLIQDIIKDSNI